MKRVIGEYQVKLPYDQEEVLEEENAVLFMIMPTLKLEKVNEQLEIGISSWPFHQMKWWKEP